MTALFHTSPNLAGVKHGFFTTGGGVSSGVYKSLNCGPGSDDNPENVSQNHRRVAEALAQPTAPVLTLYQIHSPEVVVVDAPWAMGQGPKADAMVTNKKGIILGVLTADCGPVLFADPDAGVIATAHAGWKGALYGVLENTIAAMERLGAKRRNIKACLGPSIHQASYEVSDDFKRTFEREDSAFERFFKDGKTGHHQFDLPAFVLSRLSEAHITASAIDMDTYPPENGLFSYRRTTHRKEGDYGRQISAIVLE